MKKITLLAGLAICAVVQAEEAVQQQATSQVTFIPRDEQGYPCVQSVEDACAVYPKTIQEAKARWALAQKEALDLIEGIIACPAEKHNKETILYALDRVYAWIDSTAYTTNTVGMVHPDEAMRNECSMHYLLRKSFGIEHIEGNKPLYKALKMYYDTAAKTETLTPEERYFLKTILTMFESAGFGLSDDKAAQLTALKQRCAELETAFANNMNNDTSTVTVSKEELVGLSEDFIASLPRDGERYVLAMKTPICNVILKMCTVQATRKAVYDAYCKRAYPANVQVVSDLIDAQDALAKLLGYKSYAQYDLAKQMIQTPERAWTFLKNLQKKVVPLAIEKCAEMTKDLPEGVSLTKTGTLQCWDYSFVSDRFMKKHYGVDQELVAEYFPLEQTIAGLIKIYEQFFSIVIETISVEGMWHQDVQLVRVSTQDKEVLGYVFLDMFPREKKYPHVATFFGSDGIKKQGGARYPAVVSVVCNFTRPLVEKPALLKYGEVVTFFHEFGHALHAAFGVTPLYYQSGTKNVMRDFVEMPSQFLEKWLDDKDMLKIVSRHYRTGDPLPDALIINVLKASQQAEARWACSDLTIAMLLLSMFEEGQKKNVELLVQKYREENCPFLEYGNGYHSYCSVMHVGASNYGPKYYGYLWSQVLGDDVFEQIEKEGLLNPVAGKKYVNAILSCGGSKDANDMLRDYLGREPRPDAFYRKMGI